MSMNTLIKINLQNTCNSLLLKSLQQQSYQAKSSWLYIFHFCWPNMNKAGWNRKTYHLWANYFCLLLDAGSHKNTEANDPVFCSVIFGTWCANRRMNTDFRDLHRQTSLPLLFWTVAPLTFAITCSIEDACSLFQSFMCKHLWLASP